MYVKDVSMGRCFIHMEWRWKGDRGTAFFAIEFKIDKDLAKNVVIFNKEI